MINYNTKTSIFPTVDGRNPKQPPGMKKNNCFFSDFWTINIVSPFWPAPICHPPKKRAPQKLIHKDNNNQMITRIYISNKKIKISPFFDNPDFFCRLKKTLAFFFFPSLFFLGKTSSPTPSGSCSSPFIESLTMRPWTWTRRGCWFQRSEKCPPPRTAQKGKVVLV